MFLVVGLVGFILLFSYQRASGLAEQSLRQGLTATRSLYENFELERLEKLELVNSAVAQSPIFRAVVAEGDAATALDSAQEMLQQVGSDFMIVTDSEGVVLARTDLPGRGGEDLSGTPSILYALEGESAYGVWREGEKLYHAVSVPLTVGPVTLGSITAGYQIGDYLAQDIKKFAGCEVVFFAGTGRELRLAGSTLAENTTSFRDWLAERTTTSEADDLRPVLGGETYHAILAPLETADGEVVGVFAALRSRDRELGAFRSFQRSVLLVGGLMLVLAVIASLFVSRSITRPIKNLVSVTDRVREGDYTGDVDVESEEEIGSLAGSFRALLEELREKSLMEKYISKSTAEMIQRTGAFGVAPSESQPVTVLFSDLRAFIALSGASKPEEVLSAVNRALGRQAELVASYGGQVDKFVGDRMMAVFRGENMVWRAVRCANAIQQYMDEERGEGPTSLIPSIGLSSGEAVFGSVGSSDRLDYTLLGTAVHVAGRLCDEALPGDILLSENAFEKVRDRVAAEGLEQPMTVHGLEAPLSVYLLSTGTVRKPAREEARPGSGTLRAVGQQQPVVGQPTVVSQPTTAPPPLPLTSLRPGFILGNRYEIKRLLGSGGMGMVFQAHDRELDEPVALKVLRPEIVSMSPEAIERFKRETKTARRIADRTVVRTYDFGDTEGFKFITMEYVQGITLKQLLKNKGALPLGIGLRIGRQICSGLIAAHEEGIVHRDVKPQNILLTQTSGVKIMDFGIARPKDTKGLTATGLVIGTPDYMSPEQAQGKQDLDHRSDIYSAGVVFYEMFTGALPFRGESSIGTAMQHIQQPPTPPRQVNPGLPQALEAIILRCLEKAPAERYQKMAELQRDLQHITVPPS